jgi:hypothetical protein
MKIEETIITIVDCRGITQSVASVFASYGDNITRIRTAYQYTKRNLKFLQLLHRKQIVDKNNYRIDFNILLSGLIL